MDSTKWPEVRTINRYAVFIGSLEMGIKALGIFIVTWTTVVLLGGFVSILDRKDFWCLTVIMLLQPAGLFNQNLGHAKSSLVHVWVDFVCTSFARARDPLFFYASIWRVMLSLLVSVIEALLIAIILCPVMILYVFGMYISAGIGLWRLTEHKFGNAVGAENLKPALQLLYNLAVVQGVIYSYKAIHIMRVGLRISDIVEVVSMDSYLVSRYIGDTIAGCEKDPSFAKERNFVTYAVDLMMDAKSNDDFVIGVTILGVVIIDPSPTGLSGFSQDGRPELAQCLLTRSSPSSSHLIPRLLEMLDDTSTYNETIRAQAAGIVALLASSIYLEEHPRWIDCISSTLEAFYPETRSRSRAIYSEDDERYWLLEEYEQDYMEKRNKFSDMAVEGARSDISANYIRLLRQGFNALRRLAVHKKNCKILINTEGLLPKIMAPINSEQLHKDQHDVWATIAKNSHKLVMQCAAVPGETREKVRHEIEQSSKAIITTLESILECLECVVGLKTSAVEVVLDLSVDMSSIMKASGGRSGRILNWILLLIFLLAGEEARRFDTPTKNSSDTGRLAGEKLSSNQELPLQQSVCCVLGDLTAALVSAGDILTRLHAAKTLGFLVRLYAKDGEYLNELKEAIIPVMPQVLKEMRGRGSTGEAETKAANNVQSSSSQHDDLEKGGVSGGREDRKQASSSQQQAGDEIGDIERRLRKELTKLCWSICTGYEKDPDVTRQLDAIAEKVYSEHGEPVKT